MIGREQLWLYRHQAVVTDAVGFDGFLEPDSEIPSFKSLAHFLSSLYFPSEAII